LLRQASANSIVQRTISAINDRLTVLKEQNMPTIDLDKTDLKILHHLQSDGRISNAEQADTVGLSPLPCLRSARALEEAGVLRRYAAGNAPASKSSSGRFCSIGK